MGPFTGAITTANPSIPDGNPPFEGVVSMRIEAGERAIATLGSCGRTAEAGRWQG